MVDQNYQKINRIKQNVEKDFLKIPGVVAVGIGKTSKGQSGIIVSVTELSLEIQTSIPTQIEGIPIEIKVTGPFEAL